MCGDGEVWWCVVVWRDSPLVVPSHYLQHLSRLITVTLAQHESTHSHLAFCCHGYLLKPASLLNWLNGFSGLEDLLTMCATW